MRKYIEKNYRSNFADVADKMGVSITNCLDDFMKELHYQATDIGNDGEDRDPHEFVQYVFSSMEGYGIKFDNIDHANEFLKYAMKVMNSTRLWHNHGHTPDELMRYSPINPETLTIVPGSTNAAEILATGREQFESMGMHVDFDTTATNIPIINFDNGINGTMMTSTKKVYPNDPCPCGSGKKHKKCCGK
jgi:hypothetical protein